MAVWQILIGNLATVALAMSLWMHLQYKFYRLSKMQVKLGLGLAMGLGAIASMLLSVELVKGTYFDLRISLVALSAIYGGPVALAVTAPMALLTRLILGGAGAANGVLVMSIVSVIGLVIHFAARGRTTTTARILANATIVGLFSLGTMMLMPPPGAADIVRQIGPVVAALNLVATAMGGFVLAYFHRFTLERDVLHAALTQAPDFHYVKNLDGRFVVTNLQVARHHGRKKSSEMVGLTDFDLETPERARELDEREREIMRTGEGIADFEERLVSPDGSERWYTTSKVALRNRQGDLIGLSGVTRDITSRKRLEQDVEKNRNLLSQAMAEMSDGLAMFDKDGVLVFCNDQYRAAFPRSAYARQPGTHISEIVRAVVRNGERTDVPTNVSEAWIQNAARELHADRDTEIPLFNDRWLGLRTRLAQDGSALVVVSDITEMKKSEQSLKDLAAEMKGLAETDALTSIANRRVFDQTIAAECKRSTRTGAPLSLLLVDVDRFKKYNDTYGHQAGDECLRKVGQCLANVAKRPTDLVARYGGEEFALLLPETDLDGAVKLAEEFRQSLLALGLAHQSSEFGIVTASVGVSTMAGNNPYLNPPELLARADEALYRAKEAGRNRVETSKPEDWTSHLTGAAG